MADTPKETANNYTATSSASPPIPYSQPEDPESSPLGVFAPLEYSSEPFAKLSENAQAALMQLDLLATKTDVAARRFCVEQTWEALH